MPSEVESIFRHVVVAYEMEPGRTTLKPEWRWYYVRGECAHLVLPNFGANSVV